mmetsp:Transcript_27354/g.68637  ORF Transcript_27354/g.68637 Transcript_27354/m.68637 type:complete len:229 (-) Transcript_27354:55-741(-)
MPPATPFVIFDCDGVLVDSEPHSCAALRAAIHTVTGLDIPHKYPHDYYPVFGFSVHSCLEYYKERFGKDWDVEAILEKVVEEKEAEYQRLAKGRLQTFPGFAEFLARARDAGCSFGIGSSGAMSKILFNLEEAGILGEFEREMVVSATSVARGKPFPDVYLEVMRRMGAESGRTMVIEDAVHGLRAAREAGAFAVGLTTSLPREYLEPHADLVIDSFEELDLAAIKRV